MSLDYCIYEVKIGGKKRQKRSEIEEGKEIIKVDITLQRHHSGSTAMYWSHCIFAFNPVNFASLNTAYYDFNFKLRHFITVLTAS